MTISEIRPVSPPPSSYLAFIEEMKAYVCSKGLRWTILVQGDGSIARSEDWDIRTLTSGHRKFFTGLTSFAVDTEMVAKAVALGRGAHLLPQGGVLSQDCQDCLKAIVALNAQDMRSEVGARDTAAALRRFMSVVSCPPWEISSEDVDVFCAIAPEHAILRIARVLKVFNARLLSRNIPLTSQSKKTVSTRILESLGERENGKKLPPEEALFELIRIIFHEQPRSHLDEVLFYALRVQLLTGLRINEVLMLPYDCLIWEEHQDYVTGRPAGDVGGHSTTLRLKYFALKHMDGRPDRLVVEHQWVPHKFQLLVAAAIKCAIKATKDLRVVLKQQHQACSKAINSDLRTFNTSDGAVVRSCDLVFLTIIGSAQPRPEALASHARIGTCNSNVLSGKLGRSKKKNESFFFVYAKEEEKREWSLGATDMTRSLNSHQFRHLLNDELFRLNVPDTIITHQFGRKSVAQSYEYFHPTLEEKIDFVSLPAGLEDLFPAGSAQEHVAKMVVSGLADGSHMSSSFLRIQRESGDLVAFKYLAANTSGVHATPFGLCNKDFSLDPCSRHLKCPGCRHLAMSSDPVHRQNMSEVREKYVELKRVIQLKPMQTQGRMNQLSHANALIADLDKALSTPAGELVNAKGPDFSR